MPTKKRSEAEKEAASTGINIESIINEVKDKAVDGVNTLLTDTKGQISDLSNRIDGIGQSVESIRQAVVLLSKPPEPPAEGEPTARQESAVMVAGMIEQYMGENIYPVMEKFGKQLDVLQTTIEAMRKSQLSVTEELVKKYVGDFREEWNARMGAIDQREGVERLGADLGEEGTEVGTAVEPYRGNNGSKNRPQGKGYFERILRLAESFIGNMPPETKGEIVKRLIGINSPKVSDPNMAVQWMLLGQKLKIGAAAPEDLAKAFGVEPTKPG